MTLGERIQYFRKRAGLSQEGLAERLGVSRQAVSKWETDEALPDAERIISLAVVLGVTTDALLGREEPQSPAGETVSLTLENAPHTELTCTLYLDGGCFTWDLLPLLEPPYAAQG